MPEKKIQELLRKYLDGRATPEEEKLVDDWYDSLSFSDKTQLSDAERSIFRSYYWNSIRSKMPGHAGRERNLSSGLIGLAASVAAIVVMALFFFPSGIHDRNLSQVNAPPVMEEIFNETDENRQVRLPDSSRVVLFPGSSLQYTGEFNMSERKVHLSGQAFFDISHDEKKPFYVLANEVVTKVLGTSFCVTAYPEDGSITVAVKSGKVSVYTHAKEGAVLPDEEKIILTPNQQAVYTRSDQKVSRVLVRDPQVVIPEEEVKKIRFEGVPVSEIFKALEKMYNVEIDFEEDAFSRCSITTSATGKDLYERIDVICDITGASYRVENTTIVISGTGCN